MKLVDHCPFTGVSSYDECEQIFAGSSYEISMKQNALNKTYALVLKSAKQPIVNIQADNKENEIVISMIRK